MPRRIAQDVLRLRVLLLIAGALLLALGRQASAAESPPQVSASVTLAPQVFLPQLLKSDWRGSSFGLDGRFLLVVDDSRSFILDAVAGREVRGIQLPAGQQALWSRPMAPVGEQDYSWLVTTDRGLLLKIDGRDGTATTVASFPSSAPNLKYRTEDFTFEFISSARLAVNLRRTIETKTRDGVRRDDQRKVFVLSLSVGKLAAQSAMSAPSTFETRDTYLSVNADAGYVAMSSPDGREVIVWDASADSKQPLSPACFYEGENKIRSIAPLGHGFLALEDGGSAFVLDPRDRPAGRCTEKNPAKLEEVSCQFQPNVYVIAGRGQRPDQLITVAKDYAVAMTTITATPCTLTTTSLGNIKQAYFDAPIFRSSDVDAQQEIAEDKGFVAAQLGASVLMAAGQTFLRLDPEGKAPAVLQSMAGRPSGALEVEAGPGFLLASRAAAPIRVFDVAAGKLRSFEYDYRKYLDEAWFYNKPFAIASKLAAVAIIERDGRLRFHEALGSVNTAELPKPQTLALKAPNALCTSADGRSVWVLTNGDVIHYFQLDAKGDYREVASLKLGDHHDVFKIACAASGGDAVASDSLTNTVYVFSMFGNAVKLVQRLTVPGSSGLMARPSLSDDALVLGVGPNLFARATNGIGFKQQAVLKGAERLVLNAAADRMLAVGSATRLYRVQRAASTVRLTPLTAKLGEALDGAFIGSFFVTLRGAESLDLHTGDGEQLGKLAFGDGDRWLYTDGQGRFDTQDAEGRASAYWVMKDDPMRPLDPEQFMRDYLEPRLLPRLMDCKLEVARRPEACAEAFQPIRAVDALNRARPSVEFLSVVQDPSSANSVTLNLRVLGEPGLASQRTARGSGAFDLHVRRDGQLIARVPVLKDAEHSAGISYQESRLVDGVGAIDVRVPDVKLPHLEVSGTVQFSAYAFNDDRVKGPTQTRSHPVAASTQIRRRAFVVAIGTSAYEDQKLDLRYPAEDAKLLIEQVVPALRSTKRFAEIVPILLTSEWKTSADVGREVLKSDSSKARIRRVLESIGGSVRDDSITLSPSTPDDTVIILMSGHGLNFEEEFYLVPYDSGPKLQERAGEAVLDLKRQISSAELAHWMRDLVADEIALIVDACHSSASVETPNFKPGPMGARGFGQLAYDKGMRVLASTRPDDLAWESEAKGHGLLSHALLSEGLMQRKADRLPTDGTITVGEWLQYAVDRVPALYGEVSKGLGGHDARIVLFDADTRTSREVSVNGRRVQARSQQPSVFNFRRSQDTSLSVVPSNP